MVGSLITLLSKRFTVRQQDFVKSFVAVFPISYVECDAYIPTFEIMDVITRCMYAATVTVCLFSFSFIMLWVLSRLEHKSMRHGVFFFVGPAVLNLGLTIAATRPYALSDNVAVVTRLVFYNYFYFFAPLFFYHFILSCVRRFENKHDDVEEHVAGGNSEEKTDKE